MRKKIARFGLIGLLLSFLLVACGGADEELPTVVPLAVVPEVANTPTPAPIQPENGVVPEAAPGVVDEAEIDWPPQLVYSSPFPGEEVLLDGAITVRFDQPMDQASVEAAFGIETEDGAEKTSGTFSWPSSDTLIFTPNQLEREQRYQVRIDETAVSLNNIPLELPIELQLQTVGFLEATQLIPANGTQDVGIDSAITVLFNRPVVPLLATGEQANLPDPLSFEPPVAGHGEWISTSIYRFTPRTGLAGATSYQVTVDPALSDISGGVLANQVSWQFTTLNPRVVTISPENEQELVGLDEPIVVTFNMPMDRDSAETAVSLTTNSDAPTPTFEPTWSDGGRVLTLTPIELFGIASRYQISVGVGARAASGTATLDEVANSNFNTVPLPSVRSTTPAAGVTADVYQRGFTIRFASPMDAESFAGKIRINPAPEGSIRSFYNEFSHEYSVDFNLALNERYNITVPKIAADPYGNTIGEDYHFTFDTSGRQPIASLNLPSGIAQLSNSFVTQIEMIVVNVSHVSMELYDVGLPIGLLTRPFELRDYRPAATPRFSWEIPIGIPSDEVATFPWPLADGGTLPNGVYFLTVDTPETNADVGYWQNQRQILIVADTNIVVKEMFGAVHVWVTDLRTGQPVGGRSLTLYNEQGVQMQTAVSDNSGFASFANNSINDYLQGVTVVSGNPSEAGFGIGSSVWNQGVTQFGSNDESDYFAYLYTDRPIYRPGDTVSFKGIVRDANYGRYAFPTIETINLELNLASYFGEGGLNESFRVTIDPDGSFSGDYTLPDDAPLGRYELNMPTLNNYQTTRPFTVAEYRRPEFLVSLTPQQPELLRGESVDVVLEAEYFFGGSATDLTVQWTAYDESYAHDLPIPFAFGDNGGFLFNNTGGFFAGGAFGGNQIASGEGMTDRNGRLTITLPADLLNDAKAGSRSVRIEANVLDLSNFPIAAETAVTFHAANNYVGVSPANRIVTAGNEAIVNVQTVDWDGDAVGNQTVDLIYYRREWESTRTQDFGTYYTRWEPVDTEVARQQLRTDDDGAARGSFVPAEGGTYLAVATITDRDKRVNLSSTLIWVTDSHFINWRLDPRNKNMEITLDKDEYRPGETAQLLIQSPFADPVTAWLTIERGTLLEQRLITLEGSSSLLNIPITNEYAPNVFVSVTAIKGVNAEDGNSPHADIRLGFVELLVSPEQFELNVQLIPQKEAFEPGETAVYDILVTDYQGNPVQADLSLALVDLAVLTLKEDNAPSILEAFYSRQPYRGQIGSGLFISGEGLEAEIPVEAGGFGGGGGGLAPEAALARIEGEDEDGVRRDFPDTAFWEAHVATDGNGRFTIEIPLPDTLTTWRLSSKAVTSDTKVGQTSVDIVTSLPLLLRPVTPRFFTVGDVVEIGAIVNNNTDAPIEATVRLEATGLHAARLNAKQATVPANGQALVQWEVTVADVEFVEMTFRVEGGGHADATKPSFGEGPDKLIPVYRYSAEDFVATSGVLDEAGRRVEAILLPQNIDASQGAVSVQLAPSLGAALLDGLEAHNRLPYSTSCAHAIADRLLPHVAAAQAIQSLKLAQPQLLKELNGLVETAVSQLQSLALPDGGWGYCSRPEPNILLTANVLHALVLADQAGYDVSETVMNTSTGLLFNSTVPSSELTEPWAINRQIFVLYVLSLRREYQPGIMNGHFVEHRSLMDSYAKALLAMSLTNSGVFPDAIDALLADLNDASNLSATGAHWQDSSRDFRNLSSDIRASAIVLQALTQLDAQNQLLPQAVRWLMTAKTAAHWSTPHETAWVVQALTGWMAATGELDADYAYELNVNLETVANGRFTQENLTDNLEIEIPIPNLSTETVNFVDVQRGDGDGRLYYTLGLNSFVDAAGVTAVNRGIGIERHYYDADCDPEARQCTPIEQISAGERVRVELSITVAQDLIYAIIEDPIPAGAEAIDPNLETSVSGFGASNERSDLEYKYGYWGYWFFNRVEFRDEQVRFLAEFLPAGTYQYTYFLQTTIPGEYQVRPTFAYQEFFVEVNGRSDGLLFTIK